MTWNKEKPKTNGYYWFRTEKKPEAKLLKVEDGMVKAGLWLFEIPDLHDGEFQSFV